MKVHGGRCGIKCGGGCGANQLPETYILLVVEALKVPRMSISANEVVPAVEVV